MKRAKSIEGPITKSSVLKAYKHARNVPVPLLGSNWSFGHALKVGSCTDHFALVIRPNLPGGIAPDNTSDVCRKCCSSVLARLVGGRNEHGRRCDS